MRLRQARKVAKHLRDRGASRPFNQTTAQRALLRVYRSWRRVGPSVLTEDWFRHNRLKSLIYRRRVYIAHVAGRENVPIRPGLLGSHNPFPPDLKAYREARDGRWPAAWLERLAGARAVMATP